MTDPDPSFWQSWVLSPENTFKDLPRRCIERLNHFMILLGVKNQNFSALDDAWSEIWIPDELSQLEDPFFAVDFPVDLADCAAIAAIYGYCGLLLYMAGEILTQPSARDIAEETLVYHHSSLARYILTGEGKLGPSNYTPIHRCWAWSSPASRAIIREAAAFNSMQSLPWQVVYSATKYLAHSGMESVIFIREFLAASPWASWISVVRPAYDRYMESVREVCSQPAYLQPYYKVLMGDSTSVFHRDAIMPLAACAVAWKRRTTPALRWFDVGEGGVEAVAAFEQEVIERGYINAKIFSAARDVRPN